MLCAALGERSPAWREAAVRSQLSLPRLLELRCEPFSVLAAGGGGGGPVGAAGSGALLRLRMEATTSGMAPTAAAGSMPETADLTLRLDAGQLRALVGQLQGVREQLAAIAGSGQEGE